MSDSDVHKLFDEELSLLEGYFIIEETGTILYKKISNKFPCSDSFIPDFLKTLICIFP